jgi:hypothetical protein
MLQVCKDYRCLWSMLQIFKKYRWDADRMEEGSWRLEEKARQTRGGRGIRVAQGTLAEPFHLGTGIDSLAGCHAAVVPTKRAHVDQRLAKVLQLSFGHGQLFQWGEPLTGNIVFSPYEPPLLPGGMPSWASW